MSGGDHLMATLVCPRARFFAPSRMAVRTIRGPPLMFQPGCCLAAFLSSSLGHGMVGSYGGWRWWWGDCDPC